MAMFDREQLYSPTGKILTKSLFSEFGTGPNTILSLRDTGKFPSLKNLYVNLCTDDPSEYTFATTVFGNVQFWETLKQVTWMEEALEEWRHEAAIKRKSEAFKSIIKEVKEDGRNAYQAAKYIIDEPWTGKTKASREASRKSTAEAVPAHVYDLQKHLRERKG